MDKKLLERYHRYASSDEALAVLFVREHLPEAVGHWIDPEDFRRYEQSPDRLHFRFVVGGLYRRRLRPVYPPESAYTINGKFDEHNYAIVVRAITWEAAHKDISQQKAAKVQPVRFEVAGVSYDKNRSNKSFFSDDAPPEIKALANNLQDRTDPLWDRAMAFVNRPQFVYEIRRARVIGVVA